MTTSLLVSVRSGLASKIISGEKPWEMRKSAPKTQPDYLIVYAKKPIGMAIGYAKIANIPSFFWYRPHDFRRVSIVEPNGKVHSDWSLDDFLNQVCISEKEFRDYFTKDWLRECPRSMEGAIIQLVDPIAVEPVKLPFQPPQQWRYLEGHPEEVITEWRNKC